MKIDIVIDFYKRFDIWPLVAWGLDQNAEHINKLLLVNDARWSLVDIDTLQDMLKEVNIIPLDHERRGITPQRSIRQGAQEVETEYFAHIDSDVVLAPGSLAANLELVEKELIVYGTVPDVSKHTKLDCLDDPTIARPDWRIEKPVIDLQTRFRMCRDSYWIMRQEDYVANDGGHDINFPGYGCVDYDFACRWMMRFGLESWMIGPGVGYHVGGDERQHETDPVNAEMFQKTWARYKEALEKHAVTT